MATRYDQMNEAALAARGRDGDKEALRRLLEANWAWLKGLAFNILGNQEDAEEVLQTVCVQVIKKISTLREPERFKPWLSAVARHAALGYRRQRGRRALPLEEAVLAESGASRQGDTLNRLSRQELAERILEAARLLPEKYGEAFMLKYVDDLSYAEIGEILDVPVTTVQIRLVRARRMIHDRVEGRAVNKIPRT